MIDFSEAMAGSDGLRAQAQALLECKLAEEPGNSRTLWQLAEILRQKGDLDASLDLYRRLLDCAPHKRKAMRLRSILSGEVPDASFIADFRSAPFAVVDSFLGEADLQAIWKLVDDNIESFRPAEIAGGLIPEYRSSRLLKEKVKRAIPWFLDRIWAELTMCWNSLEVSSFERGPSELQLTNHLDGEFYKVHKDQGTGADDRDRRVTFVYYFYSLPRQFEGGDLLLFDTDTDGDRAVGSYTRIIPVHNTVVFFPSNYYHQVTPVTADSSDIRHGRFTLNGWLHDTDRTS